MTYFGSSAETSDFIVDCLSQWWQGNREHYQHLEELMIELDGGSATRSNRSQFIKRIVELAKEIGLKIRLIYYPPYHSKYNPIERCWAALENYWHGAILGSVESALGWVVNMTWKGLIPIVYFVSRTYEKNRKVAPDDLLQYQDFWLPSELLPKWDVTILPH